VQLTPVVAELPEIALQQRVRVEANSIQVGNAVPCVGL
jgi:hypothetical protein